MDRIVLSNCIMPWQLPRRQERAPTSADRRAAARTRLRAAGGSPSSCATSLPARPR